MNFFKRFEVWLVLLLAAAVSVYALRGGKSDAPPTTGEPAAGREVEVRPKEEPVADSGKNGIPAPAETGKEGASLSVTGVKVEPVADGQIVTLTLSGRIAGEEELVLGEQHVKAVGGQGEAVSWFFEPFTRPAALSPGESRQVDLRLWAGPGVKMVTVDVLGETLRAEW